MLQGEEGDLTLDVYDFLLENKIFYLTSRHQYSTLYITNDCRKHFLIDKNIIKLMEL